MNAGDLGPAKATVSSEQQHEALFATVCCLQRVHEHAGWCGSWGTRWDAHTQQCLRRVGATTASGAGPVEEPPDGGAGDLAGVRGPLGVSSPFCDVVTRHAPWSGGVDFRSEFCEPPPAEVDRPRGLIGGLEPLSEELESFGPVRIDCVCMLFHQRSLARVPSGTTVRMGLCHAQCCRRMSQTSTTNWTYARAQTGSAG